MNSEPFVSLDSLDARRGPKAYRFRGPRKIIEAWGLNDVMPALVEIEALAASGLHAAGFVAYEAARAFDGALGTRPPAADLPLLWFGIFDEREEVLPVRNLASASDFRLGNWREEIDDVEHARRVQGVRELIRAGDTYQANLTHRARADFSGNEAALYHHLCQSQRAAYCAYIRTSRFSVLSASPELFFQRTGDELELRPMKGTAPRGRWPEEDAKIADRLRNSPKEIAENLMIVDLLRNDAGRLAEFGSVEVPKLFEVEQYPTVHQLTSTIRCSLRGGVTLPQIFQALFPCGSVTGAPKVRTSEIIARLESSPRGVYSGAIGFVSDDKAGFSVAIRTLVLDRERQVVEMGVGSGITYNSEAAAEFQECRDKMAFTMAAPAEFRLLETLRYERPGEFVRLREHLARMERSAAYFDFVFDERRIRDELGALAKREARGPLKIRIVLDRTGDFTIESEEIEAVAGMPRIAISREPIDSHDAFMYHKTTRRDAHARRLAARPDCDDVLMVNERGELTESTIANLVVTVGGERLTPPLTAGVLPGILRGVLLRNGEIREATLMPGDLETAESVCLISSLRGCRKVEVIQ